MRGMKLVLCLECNDIFSPGIAVPKRCTCGYSLAQWEDPRTGVLKVDSRMGIEWLMVLGLNNDWLRLSAQVPPSDREIEDAQHKAIAESTSERAEGYLFKTRNCPVIMVRANKGGDIIYDHTLHKQVEWFGQYDVHRTLPNT